MKIRKSVLKQDLRNMPIDHGDMFLMSQAEDLIDSSEVAEMVPWEAEETERRLAALVELGLLEWVNEKGEPIERGQRDDAPNFYVAVTLRPKAPEPAADLFRQTETSVVALRALDGLLFFDQAVIHNDRSVFARATFVKEEPRVVEGPVFATARPPSPTPDELMHFSLPPLSGVMPSLLSPPARTQGAAVARTTDVDSEPVHFSLPPLLGRAPHELPLVPKPELRDQDALLTFSLPPFPGDEEEVDLGMGVPDTLGDRDEPAWPSLPPFPEDDASDGGFLSRETRMQDKRAEPIRFTAPAFVAPKQAQPSFMTRATRVVEQESESVLSRATLPGSMPPEAKAMARGTLVYEKPQGRSVYERTTVVDEDVEERARVEKASTLRQGGSKRR